MRLDAFAGQSFALFGLGGSGLATAKALLDSGAAVLAFDDKADAVEKARSLGVPTADLRDADWRNFQGLVLAPGVPLTHPKPHWSVVLAQKANVPVIGDMELFAGQSRHAGKANKTIAITGTNGKSTTTALIAHMFSANGRQVAMGGNIGTPVLDLPDPADGLHYILECSSYQIDLAPSIDADVAIMLNLSPDHLDRHGDMAGYAAVKEKLVAQTKSDGVAVIGTDDEWSAKIAINAKERGQSVLTMSVNNSDCDLHCKGSTLTTPHGTIELAGIETLRGLHNAQNALAAAATGLSLGLTTDQIQTSFRSFGGLAHRMELVGQLESVLVVNDSKATNADAVAHALASYERIFWIAGGRAKSGGIDSLKEFFPKIVKAYLIGEAAQDFSKSLGNVDHDIAETLERAVGLVATDVQEVNGEGAVILLSPACASFDQYRSFEVRGDAFKALVRAHPGFRAL